MPLKIAFDNPRLRAEFADWPSGGKRVSCVFQVEHHPKRGWRIGKTTTGKPKFSTYGGQAAIVDGSDGKTYLLQVAEGYGFVKIMSHDFMNAPAAIGMESAVFASNEPDLHRELLKLIVQGGAAMLAMQEA